MGEILDNARLGVDDIHLKGGFTSWLGSVFFTLTVKSGKHDLR